MRQYKNVISLSQNDRGIWDLDVSKGCTSGVLDDPKGCYSDCYAARSAKIYGYDFSKTVLRDFKTKNHEMQIIRQINKIKESFIRIGCSGDPSENWDHTFKILQKIKRVNKEIVIITKHWNLLSNFQLNQLSEFKLCINTSCSALDKPDQLARCVNEYNRLKPYCKSFLRIVSCDFNKENESGLAMSIIQSELFKNELTIDTVFRPNKNNQLVLDKVINVKIGNFLGKKTILSKFNKKTYVGKCEQCTEQCGVFKDVLRRTPFYEQTKLFQ